MPEPRYNELPLEKAGAGAKRKRGEAGGAAHSHTETGDLSDGENAAPNGQDAAVADGFEFQVEDFDAPDASAHSADEAARSATDHAPRGARGRPSDGELTRGVVESPCLRLPTLSGAEGLRSSASAHQSVPSPEGVHKGRRAVTPDVEMLRAALTSSASGTFSGSLRSFGPLRGKRARASHLPSSSSGGLSRDDSDSHGSGAQSPPCVPFYVPLQIACWHDGYAALQTAPSSRALIVSAGTPRSLHLHQGRGGSRAHVRVQRWRHRCTPVRRSLDGGYAPPLDTLHEHHDEGVAPPFDDFEAAGELPDVPVATFDAGGTQLRETNTWSQTQPHETQGITGETVAVLDALRQMEGGEGGAAALSFGACTAGLGRREAAKVFYQLLGAHQKFLSF